MRLRRALPAIVLLGLAGAAWAQAADFKLSGNLEVWAYGAGQTRQANSPFNPDNRIARLASARQTVETRLNLRLRDDATEFVLRPRLVQQHETGRDGNPDSGDAYLSQGFVRQRLTPGWTLSAGRELLTWGPANFRSPSNPLYFDAGKTTPLRDVAGVDLVRLGLTDNGWSATVARVFSDTRLADNPVQAPLTLAKFDWRGDDNQFSLIAATPVHAAPFLGAFAQQTLGDAWLLYGEAGDGKRQFALQANPGPYGAPFSTATPSARKWTALLGLSYTLENGQSLAAEYLHDEHGYSRRQEQAVFATASRLAAAYRANPNSPQADLMLRGSAQALGQAPALLGRDYLALQWQSNPQDTAPFWRVNWTHNLTDRGQQLTAYYERNLAERCSAFVVLAAQHGPRDSEAQRLWDRSLTLGVKLFLL
jgi:hypothetical protein